jgi:anti-sigma regulatory factor (Ser/Thr protein kinase)
MGRSGQPPLHSVVDLPLAAPHTQAVEMSLPAVPENIAVVRRLLGAVGEALQLDTELVEDLRLAVTEACTNVVRHAYGGDVAGPIELTVAQSEDRLRIVVGDRGRGLGPSPDTSGPGLGLPLIAAIADSVEIERRAPGTGSRVAMSFARRRHEAAA